MFVRTLYAKPFSVETSHFACKSHLYVGWCRKEWFFFVILKFSASRAKNMPNSVLSNLNTYLSDRLSRSCVKSASHVFFDYIFFIVHLPLVITHFRSLFYSNIITPPSVEFLQTLMCDYLSMWLSIYLCPWPRFGLYLRNYWAHKVRFFTDGVFLGPIDYITIDFFF